MDNVFFVGSYTKADFGDYQAKGKGIYSCRIESATGKMELIDYHNSIVNPTYIAIHNSKKLLYTLAEVGENPKSVALKISEDYSLQLINEQEVTGQGPCHVCLDKTESFLAVANYGSGNIVLNSILEDGQLSEELISIQHEGSGVDKSRQEGPHAHAVQFTDDDMLLVVDLGLDEVKRYRLDRDGGRLEPHDTLHLPAGHGPRHLVFHPSGNYLFVINELISSISIFDYTQAKPKLLETISTLPTNHQESSYCAAIRIHPSGKFIYASNRGHDSIAVFSFDAIQGSLKLIQTISTGGHFPRDFNLIANNTLLIAANQASDNLFSFWLDSDTGKLSATGYELEIGTPVCVMPLV